MKNHNELQQPNVMSRDLKGLAAQHIKLVELIELDNKNAFLALNIAFSLSNSIDSMQIISNVT